MGEYGLTRNTTRIAFAVASLTPALWLTNRWRASQGR